MTIKSTKTTKTTKKNNMKPLAKKASALKKNLLSRRKKITGLVNEILVKTEGTLNDLLITAKKRIR